MDAIDIFYGGDLKWLQALLGLSSGGTYFCYGCEVRYDKVPPLLLLLLFIPTPTPTTITFFLFLFPFFFFFPFSSLFSLLFFSFLFSSLFSFLFSPTPTTPTPTTRAARQAMCAKATYTPRPFWKDLRSSCPPTGQRRSYKRRTLENLQANHARWKAAGGKKSKVNNFFNCLHPALPKTEVVHTKLRRLAAILVLLIYNTATSSHR